MPHAQGVRRRRNQELFWFLSKKLLTLVSRLSVEYSGKELGVEGGLLLGKDIGMERCLLLGKELDKKLSSLLAKWRKKLRWK